MYTDAEWPGGQVNGWDGRAHFADIPQVIVNGFVPSGIAGILDEHRDEQEEESNLEC